MSVVKIGYITSIYGYGRPIRERGRKGTAVHIASEFEVGIVVVNSPDFPSCWLGWIEAESIGVLPC
jgi:hypothetical protein